ncbi:MAG: DDE-type integrase/transposase/recombinase [Deltaproteobacteria bacterium]|nr:DDE-type integrase/transposase/recombinase [Myxococcales bacterium]MDP3213216.1 DDE-type integrase/transposase/recombinase [Deltaproteobacteria bacterium]
MDDLHPKDHAEAVALFRSEVIGALTRRDLARGELRAELTALSTKHYRPPQAKRTRTFSVTSLERWYYAYKSRGLAGLVPEARSDRGRGRDLAPTLRTLLLDIRREQPSASVPLVLRTLVADGRLARGTVSPSTVRRLYAEHGLDRIPMRDGASPKTRLRWQAERPGALWHADVCHLAPIVVGDRRIPVRVHGILDDASRYVIALEAHSTEREIDMLGILVRAVRRHSTPDALYLDNGSTYRGDLLRLACARLGTTVLHARPYDPEARGKMERFWKTLRGGCTDFLGAVASLHDINVRLSAFLDQHYHVTPHASLLGRAPGAVYAEGAKSAEAIDETKLREALTARVRRRVRRDTTVTLDGTDWELDQGFLAGRLVMVARCLVETGDPPWIEYQGKRYPLHAVDPVRNAHRKRPPRRAEAPAKLPGAASVHFDPAGALLDRAVGRPPRGKGAA